jgi:N-acetylglucosaminyldiphosphoundecaprenol N-acetyl-beta-D-mannosaminyltransferase
MQNNKVKTMNMLGINLHCISYEDMYKIVHQWLSDKTSRSHWIATVNVNVCVSSLFNKKLRDIYNSADLVGIDSMPFLKWARAFYNKQSDHLNAPDLMLEVSSKLEEKKYTYFLYGGYPGSPEKMEAYLQQRFEGVNVVGKYSPPFRKLTGEEEEAVIKMINDARPDFLWVGLGSPKQDLWIYDRLEKIHGSVIIPSGATFDFFSGRIKRAPDWIRKLGFEWLYRLTQDFRRLWVRYTVYNVIFIFVFLSQLIKIISFDQNGNLRIFGQYTTLGNNL